MGTNSKRRFSAWLLLLVYVPIMVAVSLHVHPYGYDGGTLYDGCVQCAHHVHHDGHLNAYSGNTHDCVLCQFASLPFIAATAVVVSVVMPACHIAFAEGNPVLNLGVCNTNSTRAPPFSLL